ncbi:MAG: type IV pilus biogenesis/stability protein PilW [Kangiellaceae bacterium]|nr:type IV pilus biogenesis/stability protein PilW [Kangiellaceae bacterium]
MKLVKWALVGSALTSMVLISGCETTTTVKEQISSNDRVVVQGKEADLEEAAQIRLSLGMRYLQNGKLEWAKKQLDKAYTHAPHLPEVLFGMAYYFQTVDELDLAEGYYQKVLDKSKNDSNYLNAYGVFLCDKKKAYEESVSYFLKAVDNPNYTKIGSTYENAGFCSIKAEKYTDAENYFNKALNFNPNLTKSLYGLSSVYFESGNYNRAEAYLLRFEGLSKPSADSLLLGYKIGRRLNDQVAINSYGEKLMQLYPNSEQAQTYLRMR